MNMNLKIEDEIGASGGTVANRRDEGDAAAREPGVIIAQTSYQQVRDALRNDIVAGVFKSSERLVVSALGERYGMSAPPIREALSQLQVEGLVVIEANRGARVRTITPAFVTEIFEIRIALEPALVERSVPLFKPEDVEDLKTIQDRFETAVSGGNHPEILKYNGEFHRRIYKVRQNNEASRLLDQHSTVIATMRNQFGYEPGRFLIINQEHRALISACADKAVSRAASIARKHIEHSLTDLLERIDQARHSPRPYSVNAR